RDPLMRRSLGAHDDEPGKVLVEQRVTRAALVDDRGAARGDGDAAEVDEVGEERGSEAVRESASPTECAAPLVQHQKQYVVKHRTLCPHEGMVTRGCVPAVNWA